MQHYGALWSIMEHYGTLWSFMGKYGNVDGKSPSNYHSAAIKNREEKKCDLITP